MTLIFIISTLYNEENYFLLVIGKDLSLIVVTDQRVKYNFFFFRFDMKKKILRIINKILSIEHVHVHVFVQNKFSTNETYWIK